MDRRALAVLFSTASQHAKAGRWRDAVGAFIELARLEPDRAEAHLNLGVAHLRMGRHAEAAASLERATALRPGDERALAALAAALRRCGRRTEAAEVCRKLGRIHSDPVERRYFLANAHEIEGKFNEAEMELRLVMAVAPERSASRVMLGQLLLRRGAFDEAETWLDGAMDAAPDAFRLLTKARRMTEADRPMIERMRAVAENPLVQPETRAAVHFGLGKAYNDLGEYGEAMRHYDGANALKGGDRRLDRAALATRYDAIVARFRAGTMLRPTQAPTADDELPVFVFGMPRSGTTLVEQILSSHPAVAAGDELPFWTDRTSGPHAARLDALDPEALAEAADAYRALLRQIGPRALRVTDKAPGNFERLGLLHLALPNARFIHCRRHPVDTCLSIYFEKLGTDEAYADNRGDLAFAYRQYERLMDFWREALPASQFTEVRYESLVTDQEAETRRMIAFCGLEWDDLCLAPERNARLVKTASLWQVRQPVYATSLERWRRYEPWLGELRALIPGDK